MTARATLTVTAALLMMLGACKEKTPQEMQADQLREVAEAQADAVEAEAGNTSAAMDSQAEELLKQAGQTGSFEAQKLKVRAEALKAEGNLIDQQAAAKARAIRDAGQAKASALLAQ